jgi:hypothetical protein
MSLLDSIDPLAAVLGAVGGVFLLAAMLVRVQAARIGFGVMLFAASIAAPNEFSEKAARITAWILPIQTMRSELFLGAGCVLTLGLLLQLPRTSAARISGQCILLLLIAILMAVMRGVHDDAVSSVTSVMFALVTIGTLTLLLPRLLTTMDEFYAMIRVLAFAFAAWMFCVVIQAGIDPGKLFLPPQGRFIGMHVNPQFAGEYLAVGSVVSLWLLLNDNTQRYRILWIALTGLCLIGAGASGSRTAMGMAVLGVTAILYRRLGRAVLLLPIAAISVYLTYQVTNMLGLELPLSRLLSTEDTRSGAWLLMLDQIRENPLVGEGELPASENSYLLAFASYGLGMFLLVMSFLLYSIAHCIRLFFASRRYSRTWPIVDLILGINMMYFGGAFFDGFIVARVNMLLPIMLAVGSISAVLVRYIEWGAIEHLGYDEEGDDEWEDIEAGESDDPYAYPKPA